MQNFLLKILGYFDFSVPVKQHGGMRLTLIPMMDFLHHESLKQERSLNFQTIAGNKNDASDVIPNSGRTVLPRIDEIYKNSNNQYIPFY